MKAYQFIAFFVVLFMFQLGFSQSAVVEINGLPSHVVGELIMKFSPDVLDMQVIDSNEVTFAIGTLISDDAFLDSLQQQYPDIASWTVTKLFPDYDRADSIAPTLFGTTYKRPRWWSIFLLEITEDLDEIVTANDFDSHFSGIKFCHPNWIMREHATPNDPLYATFQNDLFSTNPLFQNGHINLDRAWDIQFGGASFVKLGIIDSGIDQTHPDLTVAGGAKAVFTNILPLGSPYCATRHGTLVAGLAAADLNNNVGVAGVAGGVSMYDINVGSDPNIAQLVTGINYAVDFLQCHIANISRGRKTDEFTFNNFEILGHSIYNAHKAGTIVICSRGNSNDPDLTYPACYADPMVMNISATDENGNRAYFSSFGGTIDFGAPGIIEAYDGNNFVVANQTTKSTEFDLPTDLYKTFEGTSASAPIASGVAGLMLSYFNSSTNSANNLSHSDVEMILQLTTSDRGVTGYDNQTGWGLLDAGRGLEAIESPFYDILHFQSNTPSSTVLENSGQFYPFAVLETYGSPVASGIYLAKRYRVNYVVNNPIPSNFQVIGAWPRFESSIGYSSENPNPGFDQIYIDNPGQFSTTVYTYAYEIVNTLGQTIGWIPNSPSNLNVAYSLWVKNLNVVSVKENLDDSKNLTIFPNPCKDILNVKLENSKNRIRQLEISDMNGKVVLQQEIGGKGLLEVKTNLSRLPAGIYVIKIGLGTTPIYRKFAISN